jgi:hypothetical protein
VHGTWDTELVVATNAWVGLTEADRRVSDVFIDIASAATVSMNQSPALAPRGTEAAGHVDRKSCRQFACAVSSDRGGQA